MQHIRRRQQKQNGGEAGNTGAVYAVYGSIQEEYSAESDQHKKQAGADGRNTEEFECQCHDIEL